MEQYNKNGPPILGQLPLLQPLGIAQVHQLMKAETQVIDIRSPTAFAAGHIPGSLSIWRDGIPAFAGWFLTDEHPIILIDDFNISLETVVRRLIRLGYDNIAGYLAGGFPARCRGDRDYWHLFSAAASGTFGSGIAIYPRCAGYQKLPRDRHIRGAHNRYVGELPQFLAEIPRKDPIIVYCDAGWKGSLAANCLAKNRFRQITNVLGGMQAWKRAGFHVEKSA